MNKYNTFIFDLDGTLLNTLDDLANSTNYALRWAGMNERSKDEVRQFVGNGVKKLMERAIPDGLSNPQFDVTYAKFKEHYLQHSLDNTKPYPGIMEMLSILKDRGISLAVVSNKFYTATEELCKYFFNDYIKVAIGERENIRKKPAPDTVIESMRMLGSNKADTVYVGDSDVDIDTAHNCDVPCLSVLWGFRDKEFLLRHGATTLITKPDDLLLYAKR
jgi:phosphoglycolate phosphatase